jgi:hypothetical protein
MNPQDYFKNLYGSIAPVADNIVSTFKPVDYSNPANYMTPVPQAATPVAPVAAPSKTPIQLQSSQDYINTFLGTKPDDSGLTYGQIYGTNPAGGSISTATPASTGITSAVGTGVTIPGIPEKTADEIAYEEAMRGKLAQPDENAIRAQQMEQFQKEIDALNAVYANQKLEATQRGMGRLGSDAAIQARRGLLGSSFGGAQTEAITGQNTQEQNAIDAEKNAKIQTIMGNMRKSVADEITAKRKAISEGADAAVEYYKGKIDRTNSRVSNFVKDLVTSGVEAGDEQLNDAAKQLGVDVSVIKNQYASAKKTAEEEATKKKQTADKLQSELDTELSTRLKNKADLNKPLEAGGYIFQYNPQDGTYSQIGESRSTSAPKGESAADIKSFINTQIATKEFKALSKEQKKDFILSNGGTPSDYEY